MSLTRAQQGLYRPLVAKAWQRHCREAGLDPKDKAAYRPWYEQQLLTAIGVTSTSQASKTRGFERLMAHFEMLARNDIHWQLEANAGPARRILHSLRAWLGKHKRDEEYLRKIARQMLKLNYLPNLADLNEEQLTTIQRAVMIDHRRRERRDEDPTKARPSTRPYHRKTNREEPRFPAADLSTADDTDIPY